MTLSTRLTFCRILDMNRLLSFLSFILTAFFIFSCDGLKMPKHIFETSERAKYERDFSGPDNLMSKWKAGFITAAASQLTIPDGSSFTIFSTDPDFSAVAYSLELKKGEMLVIEAAANTQDAKIFIDVLEQGSDIGKSKSERIKNGRLTRFIENSGWHKIIIQPEIEYRGALGMKIYTQPSLVFPVAGKGNRDVQSFWGADRDGGGRRHEGVDIFASRGTLVMAVADGFVTRTGNQGLGGKQVWLRDGILGNSYYYAHLDSILTESGKQVRTGDTLGRVGNTGNAEGGPPHLHFGIYTSGGAVDPYPYLRKRLAMPSSEAATEMPSGKSSKAGSTLRTGPGTE
ncbi:M23 family metallopeptidase [Chryseobacterium sp. SSA4.19]|uniref:M23 family metallopeptidase n=1 Tax=Chryseobacterium sp. SSA4.19 TaxID=2919915 RepID=UPI001F502B0B|nr:M23 family metallopeptidase [Chryseobacterium sp. SSA4.19]MCJ8154855.1 M23 family metallopeptidase [Chryseobacterium sp. SSA4.19]